MSDFEKANGPSPTQGMVTEEIRMSGRVPVRTVIILHEQPTRLVLGAEQDNIIQAVPRVAGAEAVAQMVGVGAANVAEAK